MATLRNRFFPGKNREDQPATTTATADAGGGGDRGSSPTRRHHNNALPFLCPPNVEDATTTSSSSPRGGAATADNRGCGGGGGGGGSNKNNGAGYEFVQHPQYHHPAAPDSPHQFISDFFRTDIMNHCEFLKQLNNFGQNDAYLIAEICERLVRQTKIQQQRAQTQTKEKGGGKRKGEDNHEEEAVAVVLSRPITPFYGGSNDDSVRASDVGHVPRDDFQKHKSFPRNCYNIMTVYAAITQLAGHEYNIYELAYLNYHSRFPFRLALLIFSIQITLLWIVVHSNLQEFDVAIHQRDALIIVVDVCTTLFVITFCFGQYDKSKTFTTAARGVIGNYLVKGEDLQIKIENPNARGKWQPELMIFLNELVNQYLLALAPMLNIYFILLSGSAMDAVLNGFALLFIFELDDYVLPLFEGVDIEDKLVINAHDFIMVEPKTEDLSCERVRGPEIVHNVKLYVSVQKDKNSINIYSRRSATQYDKTTYAFKGEQTGRFLALCEESLNCLQNFKDIHD